MVGGHCFNASVMLLFESVLSPEQLSCFSAKSSFHLVRGVFARHWSSLRRLWARRTSSAALCHLWLGECLHRQVLGRNPGRQLASRFCENNDLSWKATEPNSIRWNFLPTTMNTFLSPSTLMVTAGWWAEPILHYLGFKVWCSLGLLPPFVALPTNLSTTAVRFLRGSSWVPFLITCIGFWNTSSRDGGKREKRFNTSVAVQSWTLWWKLCQRMSQILFRVKCWTVTRVFVLSNVPTGEHQKGCCVAQQRIDLKIFFSFIWRLAGQAEDWGRSLWLVCDFFFFASSIRGRAVYQRGQTSLGLKLSHSLNIKADSSWLPTSVCFCAASCFFLAFNFG